MGRQGAELLVEGCQGFGLRCEVADASASVDLDAEASGGRFSDGDKRRSTERRWFAEGVFDVLREIEMFPATPNR